MLSAHVHIRQNQAVRAGPVGAHISRLGKAGRPRPAVQRLTALRVSVGYAVYPSRTIALYRSDGARLRFEICRGPWRPFFRDLRHAPGGSAPVVRALIPVRLHPAYHASGAIRRRFLLKFSAASSPIYAVVVPYESVVDKARGVVRMSTLHRRPNHSKHMLGRSKALKWD